MRNLTNTQKAYIAGFLDGDGSVYVKLKKNNTYRYGYQIAPYITFYQQERHIKFLEWIKKMINTGYLRLRTDGVVEYTIGDEKSLIFFAKTIAPFSKLKSKQLKLLLSILNKKQKVKSIKNFIALCRLVDQFENLNYSKKRIQNTKQVLDNLIKIGLLTP